MDRPLLATDDAALADELARLSAAAGAPVAVASSPTEVLAAWGTAPVVLVGADLAAALVDLAPPRRPGVQLVGWSPAPTGTFRDALLIGAERVVELPVGADLVAELLTDLGDAGRGEGVLVGVVGARAGPGPRPSPVRSGRSPPPAARRWWSTSTRWAPGASGCCRSTTHQGSGGTRSARRRVG